MRASNPHESVHPCTPLPLSSHTSPSTHSTPEPDFERIIKPLLEREPLELDDAADMDLDDEISEIKQFVSLFWC